MSKEKVCPIMAQGWIIAYYQKSTERSVYMNLDDVLNLPECLKERCALWIAESFAGALHGEEHCGLMRRN